MNDASSIRTALPAAYLLAVSVGAFVFSSPTAALSLFSLQIALLIYHGKISTRVLQIFERVRFLFLFLIICNALFPNSNGGRIYNLLGLELSIDGLVLGCLMCLQIAVVILTSYVVRAINGSAAITKSLGALKVPELLAASLDVTLSLLESDEDSGGRGSGRGRGRGGGRGQGAQQNKEGIIQALKSRDLSALYKKIQQTVQQAAIKAETLGMSSARAGDVGIIAGIGAVMMAFKLVKILPGVAVFSGAKAIFFFPLYILASDRTSTRWGGTVAGTVMGIIAFLNGDGRYGLFEVFKHVVPGLVVDLVWPTLRKFPRSIWLYSALGLVLALARTSTEFLMVLALAPGSAELYIFPALKLIPNLSAGLLSGIVTYSVLERFLNRDLYKKEIEVEKKPGSGQGGGQGRGRGGGNGRGQGQRKVHAG